MMNTSQIKSFAIQSRSVLKAGVLNRILALGFDVNGNLTVERPVKIQGGTIFMGQLREDGFYDAWAALEERIAKHSVKEVCEEAAYTWFNRLVAIRIMQKNGFIEPVMQYASEVTRIPVIVDQARSGRLSIRMTATELETLENLLRDPTKTNDQFNLLITAFCKSNPVIYNCFGGIEKHIGLLLPDNILSQGGFIDLLNNTPYLTEDDYKQSELIGWLYQFYISEKKDEVFEKKGKYTPDEIPAATQIFTPNWIVKYMVQNTLGRIYLDNNPYSDLGDRMRYLVTSDEPTPKDAVLKIDDMEGYTIIDPACGSGHILVEAFDLLYAMYQEEAYPAKAAITSILTKNIIGLDLDTRAKQLATFALLMKACQKDPSFLDCKVKPRVLDMPEPFIYRGSTMQDFLPHYFLGGNKKTIEETTKAFELMQQADCLGSIMKFDISPETRAAIEKSTMEWEKREFVNPDIEAAIPSMKVILALTDKYATTAMNPPYMKATYMIDTLKDYVDNHYQIAQSDLYSVFMNLGMNLVKSKGVLSMIVQPTWLVNFSFSRLRESIIDRFHIDSLLHMGRGNFGNDWGSIAFTFINSRINRATHFYKLYERAFYRIETNHISTLFLAAKQDKSFKYDFSSYHFSSFSPKSQTTGKQVYYSRSQETFKKISNVPLCYSFSDEIIEIINNSTVSDYFNPATGLQTGNNSKFIRAWFEISIKDKDVKWFSLVNGGDFRKWYGNFNDLILWENDGEAIKQCKGSVLRNQQYYKRAGITWNRIASKGISIRAFPQGCLFDQAGDSMFCYDVDLLYVCMGYLNSKVAKVFFDMLAPTINLTAGMIGRLPFKKLSNTDSILRLSLLNEDISRLDWDSHEISWDFKKNELIRAQSICRQNAADMDMLSGDELEELKKTTPFDDHKIEHCIKAYKNDWERKFNQLHANEEELNRKFIEIYGLQDELKPDVPLDAITILQNGEISIRDNLLIWHDDVIIKQLISYAIGCWMGRYRLDQNGLYIAHYPTDEEVCAYDYEGHQFKIDDDAIIPLMGRDTPFEDDNALQKLDNFVKIVFGEDHLTENLNTVDHALDKSLEDYLVKDFWKDHKKMYQNRPIYWLFSSKKGAFQVVVYMHRMNPFTVEKIRTKYLLPYIEYLKGKINADEARGADLTTIERKNLAKMRVALDECTEYHNRLHNVAIKAIDFNLDDGVAVNYAKFGDVLAKIK